MEICSPSCLLRSDQSVLDLLQCIKNFSASAGRESRIVLGEAATGKKKKTKLTDNSSVTSPKKRTNSHFVRNTLNEEESQWVKN